MSDNQKITSEELAAIRKLNDFDLTMLLSETNDHGWAIARTLLPMMIRMEALMAVADA